MKKTFAILLLCLVLVSLTACLDDASTTTTLTTLPETSTFTTLPETSTAPIDPSNAHPVRATVSVKIDGVEIEAYSDLLYKNIGGHISDGPLMFLDPPYDKIPEFTMRESLEITVNGVKKESFAVRDANTHKILHSCHPDNAVSSLDSGRYLFAFDAKSTGTGNYEGESITYSYYFFVTIEK